MTQPIYIIGSSAESLYLAAKLYLIGEKVIIISDKNDNIYLSTNGITLKETVPLQQNKLKFDTSFWIEHSPKAVIIASALTSLKSLLSMLSPAKIGKAPVILFTPLKNFDYINKLLKTNITKAYLEGFITRDDQIVSVLGKEPQITICEKENSSIFDIFKNLNIPLKSGTNKDLAFWTHFSNYALSSMISADQNQNIIEAFKRKNYEPVINEMSELALCHNANIPVEDIIKNFATAPLNYFYPLHKGTKKEKTAELAFISSILSETSKASNTPIPNLLNLCIKLSSFLY